MRGLKVPGCPKRDICRRDCRECDYGKAFSRMWQIVFSYRKRLNDLQRKTELMMHPDRRFISKNNWKKCTDEPMTGTQIGMSFIDKEM